MLPVLALTASLLAANPFAAAPPKPIGPWRDVPSAQADTHIVEADLPPGDWPDAALFLEGVLDPFEVQVDGTLVLSRTDGEGAHDGWRWHLVPVGQGARHVVVTSRAGHRPFLAGNDDTLIGARADLLWRLVVARLPTAIVALTSLTVGLAALLVFLRRREERLYGLYAAFAIASGFVLLAVSQLEQVLFEAAPFWEHLRLFARTTTSPTLALFFYALTGSKRIWVRRAILAVLGGGLAILAVDLVSGGVGHALLVRYLNLLFAFCFLCTVLLVLTAFRRQPWRYLPSVLALSALLVAISGEVMIGTGLIRGPNLGPVVHLLLLAAAGDLLAQRFAGVFSALQDEVRARDEFLSMASHELRNPLAAITAGTDLLDRLITAPDTRRNVELVRRQVKNLARIVEDLLDLARIRTGRLALRPVRLDLSASIHGSVEAMQYSARAKQVTLTVEAGAGGLWCDADPTRVEQMISNLVRNAIQHTPKGGRVVVATGAREQTVEVRVTDDGRGMTEQTVRSLFASSPDAGPRRSDSEGMGIGLSVVRRLAELHGGSVSALSDGPGKGSEFRIALPRRPAPLGDGARSAGTPVELRLTPPPPAAESQRRLEALTTTVTAGAPVRTDRTVLLIDDNANLRTSMRLLLEHSGFRVHEAPDGRSGLEQLLAGGFDAAVVDLRMPEVDGLEVARRVRAASATSTASAGARLKLIALTGHAEEADKEAAQIAGFDHVLVKPADPDLLTSMLG